MTQFRRRKDNGRVFPIKNGPSAGTMNNLAKQDFNRVKHTAAKQTRNAGNKLAITDEGKIKKGSVPAIIGAQDQEAEARQILKKESEMVKSITKVEHEKHPSQSEVRRAEADIKNLKLVHPELADRVLER